MYVTPSCVLMRYTTSHKLAQRTTAVRIRLEYASRQQLVSTTTRAARFSSHNTNSSSPSTIATTQSRVSSRRLWNAHWTNKNGGAKKQQQKQPFAKNKPASIDEKPWPKSMVYGSYAAAVVVVPYLSLWWISGSPTLRRLCLPKNSNDNNSELMRRLRNHFGQVDWDSAGDSAVLYRLPLEDSASVRATQAEIEQREAQTLVVVLGMVDEVTATTIAETTVRLELPAAMPANQESLRPFVSSSSPTAAIAVYFPDADAAADSNDSNKSSENNDATNGMDDGQEQAMNEKKDPLLRTAHTYSSWFYQRPELLAGTASHHGEQQSVLSLDDMEKSRLQYEISRLETELHSGSSSRPIDDILEEVKQHKAQLRKLVWKRWVPWM
jgi:hypothetical protein